MALTYEPIATTTLSVATGSISFSTIPTTYTHLRVVFYGKMASGLNSLYLQLNNNATSGSYAETMMRGQGTSATSFISSINAGIASGGMATSINCSVIDIFKYQDTANYKSVLYKNSNSYTSVQEQRGMAFFLSTAAITTITLLPGGGGNLAIGTRATLYGIKAA